MGRNLLGMFSGLLVLVAALVVIFNLARPAEAPSIEADAATSTTALTVPSTAPIPVEPGLPGVPSAVTRVLARAGNVEFARRGDLAQLPPSVEAILDGYGVVLEIPIGSGGGQ